ncbi:MAG: dodecin [Gammaproteobacteria bacterium]
MGIQDAIENAVNKASKSIHNMRWFEVVETRGHIDQGKVAHWQVTLKVGFTLDD